MLYAILKGYKINIGTIIENSIMRYHEGNKRGVIPHPATVTILCLKAGVRGDWEAEEEVPLTSPLLLTGVSKGPRNQKKKGVLIKTGEEVPTAREEGVNTEAPPDVNNFPFADTAGQEDRSPVDFSSPLASSPPMQGRTFREQGESSRGTQENQTIMEMLLSMQNKMEAREKEWRLQQEFREEVYKKELKRRDQEWEEELQRREERFESELQRREQEREAEQKKREEQMKGILKQQGEDFKKEMEERDRKLLQKLKLIHEAFYNNQFERDSQLLTIMKEKEEKHATKWDDQIKGSQILYKSIQRDFEKKLDDRDKNQRDTEAYRQVEWLENLDLINNNLSKFLEVMTEMENTMNGLGKRQDQLNEKVDLSNQIFIEEQAEKESKKRKERMEMKFPPFPAHLDTLDLDPPNVYSSKQKRKNK